LHQEHGWQTTEQQHRDAEERKARERDGAFWLVPLAPWQRCAERCKYRYVEQRIDTLGEV